MTRLLLLAICVASLAGCVGYYGAVGPAPVAVQQQPATGTVVVQPN